MALRLAFLGTGIMGLPMASNLLKTGFSVTVWNRTRSKAEPLAAEGARMADTAATAAAGADLVITMLENGPIVGSVLFEGGVAAALKPGAVVIDMSSIPPPAARDHAVRLAEFGVGHLDAPVSGGQVGARDATLAIMVGGSADLFERAKPVLSALGRPTLVGPSGSGQLAKLANQVIVAITIGAVSEALLLAASGGADPAAVRSALMGGFADSRILTLHGQRMLERNWVPGGALKNQVKDLDTALDAADAAGVTLPVTALIGDLFRDLRDRGFGELDHAALLTELEHLNPGTRVTDLPDRLP
jgi:2-hydroxy-3-oxopropionate reductase